MLSTETDRYQPSATDANVVAFFTPSGREHCVHEKHLMQLHDQEANYNAESIVKMQNYTATMVIEI